MKAECGRALRARSLQRARARASIGIGTFVGAVGFLPIKCSMHGTDAASDGFRLRILDGYLMSGIN